MNRNDQPLPETARAATLTLQPLPTITRTAIPATWLPHARFSHKAHRILGCTSCHMEVAQSKKAADVLLPRIQVCRECHRVTTWGGVAQPDRAPTGCVTCHLYHDKSQDADWNGPFTVKGLLGDNDPG